MVHWNHPTDECQDIGKDQKVKQSKKLTRWKWLLKILYLFGQFLNFQGHQAAWSLQRSNQSATVQLCRVIHELKLARILVMITESHGCLLLFARKWANINEPAPTCFCQQQRPTIFLVVVHLLFIFEVIECSTSHSFVNSCFSLLALCFLQFYLSSGFSLCRVCNFSSLQREWNF